VRGVGRRIKDGIKTFPLFHIGGVGPYWEGDYAKVPAGVCRKGRGNKSKKKDKGKKNRT